MIVDEATGEHHLFVSKFAGPNGTSCGASSWETNSMIVHSVSTSGLHGPYVKKDVTVGPEGHNPQAIRDKNGRIAIFHIGKGSAKGTQAGPCPTPPPPPLLNKDGTAAAPMVVSSAAEAGDYVGSCIHVSDSLDGEFRPLITPGACAKPGLPGAWCGPNNPSPWMMKNGKCSLVRACVNIRNSDCDGAGSVCRDDRGALGVVHPCRRGLRGSVAIHQHQPRTTTPL